MLTYSTVTLLAKFLSISTFNPFFTATWYANICIGMTLSKGTRQFNVFGTSTTCSEIFVSVQKCHNAPICGLFAKPANLIFKYLSLKISLIQADCHWKQVLVVRSTRFHGFEQSLEILPERDSDLLASLDKGIVHCRSQYTLYTTKE